MGLLNDRRKDAAMRTNWGFSELAARMTAPPVNVTANVFVAASRRRGGCLTFAGAAIWGFALYAFLRF
jgi:hypothetical protein